MATLLLRGGSISIFDYRCGAGPADKPFVERHDGFDIAYVRRGSFGYRARGRVTYCLGAILSDAASALGRRLCRWRWNGHSRTLDRPMAVRAAREAFHH